MYGSRDPAVAAADYNKGDSFSPLFLFFIGAIYHYKIYHKKIKHKYFCAQLSTIHEKRRILPDQPDKALRTPATAKLPAPRLRADEQLQKNNRKNPKPRTDIPPPEHHAKKRPADSNRTIRRQKKKKNLHPDTKRRKPHKRAASHAREPAYRQPLTHIQEYSNIDQYNTQFCRNIIHYNEQYCEHSDKRTNAPRYA